MSWKYVKLGSICNTGAGGTPLKSKKEFYENGTIPWLRSGEVNNRNIVDCEIKITEKGLNNSSAKLFPSGTVLIAMYGATAGQVGILNFEASTNQAVCGILPNENFTTEFLYYFFLSFKENLISQAVGNAQPNISQAKIKNTLIPVIPLQEQRQIVAILNQAFTAIDQAKANIEKNIVNAKELFQSKLNAVFSQRGEGWEEQEFSKVIKLKSGQNLTTKNMVEGDYPVFGGNGIAGYHNKYNLSGKQIIIGRVGALCGNVRYLEKPFWLTDNAFQITNMKYDFDFQFLTYLLNHKNLRSLARQAAQPVISNSSLKDLILNFPKSIKEQIKIRERINLLENEVEKIIIPYNNKIAALEELKKSILQKAFAGELTENNIERLQLAAELNENYFKVGEK